MAKLDHLCLDQFKDSDQNRFEFEASVHPNHQSECNSHFDDQFGAVVKKSATTPTVAGSIPT